MADSDAIMLVPAPLTGERFAPYGDVIEALPGTSSDMNDARFARFDNLCKVDLAGGDTAISLARCRTPTALPLRVGAVERHPLGSQAFVPLAPCRMVIVVAPPGESVAVSDLRAFVTSGRQGINYHRGTWHMPLIAFDAGREFLVVDRGGDEANCDVHEFDDVVMLQDPL
jgi:ureidoglycolate lyase